MTVALIPLASSAAYLGANEITAIYGAGTISLGVASPPNDTCNYYGYQFKFDATTEAGKNMLSMLLTAQQAGKTVQVWYTPSTNPGTDHNSGCTQAQMAVLTAVGIRD